MDDGGNERQEGREMEHATWERIQSEGEKAERCDVCLCYGTDTLGVVARTTELVDVIGSSVLHAPRRAYACEECLAAGLPLAE